MLPFLFNIFHDLHTGTNARVRTRNGMSDAFCATSGVRQGCSPILAPAVNCYAIDADTTLFLLFWNRCW